MKCLLSGRAYVGATVAATVLLITVAAAPVAAADDGKALFVETFKCNQCHSVPAAEVEAKIKSEKMKGPDLGGKIEMEAAKVGDYLRQEIEVDGSKHKKEFTGSDEELHAILDWLASLDGE